MNRNSYINLLVVLLFLLPLGLAAINVTASVNKYSITMAERLVYTIQISSESSFSMSEPSPPQIPNFSFVNMRSSSSSSSSITGFRTSRSVSRTYIYYYIPKAEGSTKIPAQQIRIANKVYTTPEFEVTVVKAVGSASPQSGAAIEPTDIFNDPNLPWSATHIQGNTMILAQLQSNKVYRTQPVIVSYYLYTDQMVRSFNLDEERDFSGYGKSIYEQPSMLNYEIVNHQGKRLQRALIKRMVLLPNEIGRLQVPRLKGTARIYEFGYLSQNLVSQDKYLEVQALPTSRVPQSFSGAVGNFNLSETISAKDISLGEAITFSLRIAGTGNFNHFANPQFEAGAAQISSPLAVDRLNAGIEGSRTLYYTIIPSEKGSFSLPALSFAWFDPDLGGYREYHSPELEINVKSANVISYFSGLLDSGVPKTMHPMLARPYYPNYRSYLHSLWYWILVSAILLGLTASVLHAASERRRRSDPASHARQKADRRMKRFLLESGEAAKRGSKDFYILAERGFMQYLTEKYSIAKGLSTAEKIHLLVERGVPQDLAQQSADFLNSCALARFSPEEIPALRISEDFIALSQLANAFAKHKLKGADQ
jgi:hypothetical protein